MTVFRSPQNPIINPENVKPSRSDFEVVGVFNAGVTRFKDKVLLLLRVAERPVNPHPDLELAAVYEPAENDIAIKEFAKDDTDIDFSDPRLIITPESTFLTSLSHFRIATSNDGINFDIAEKPAMFPANEYETFGLEDPRIALIEDTYYIDYVAVCPYGVTTCLASTKDFKTFKRHGVIFCPDNKEIGRAHV